MGHNNIKIGIDIGSRNVRAVLAGKSRLICEPAVFALEISGGKILAFGSEALMAASRTPGSMQLIKPFAGDITPDKCFVDYAIKYMTDQLVGEKAQISDIAISFSGVPDRTMESYCVEAAYNAGARNVYIIDTLFAAAIGSGASIESDIVLINVGASVTDMGVYSHSKLVCSRTITAAGNAFDRAVIDEAFENHSVRLSEDEAERVKLEVASLEALPADSEKTAEAVGIYRYSGIQRKIELKGSEFTSQLCEVTEEIVDSVFSMFYDIHFEISSIVLCGGSAQLPGLNSRLAKLIDVPVSVAADPSLCVISGIDALLSGNKLGELSARKR